MEDSSKIILARFREGDPHAANEIYDLYISRLLKLIRHRISPRLQQRLDAEDIVQSAMRSFFIRTINDDYVLQRAGDLWRLLATISLNKLRRHVEIHTAEKRSISKEQTGADFLESLANRDPLPEEETALLDELNHVMKTCTSTEHEILQMRLAGETIEYIAKSIERSERTVRRLLQNLKKEMENRLLNWENY